MRGVYGNARLVVGAEGTADRKPLNVAPFIILGACAALVIAVVKNERELGKGR